MVTTNETSIKARGCTSVATSVRLLPGIQETQQAKKCFYTKCVTCKHTKYVGPHVESSFVMIPQCEFCPNGWALQSYEEEISSVARKATDMSPDELFDVITGKLRNVKKQTTQEIPTRNVDETVNQTFPGWFDKDIFTDNTKQEFATAKTQVMNWLFNGKYYGKSFLGSYMKIPIIMEPYVNLFEDTAYLLFCLIKSSSSAERYLSIVAFCKLRGSRLNSASALATVLGNILFDHICDAHEQNKRWKEMQTHVLKEVGADLKLQSYDEDSKDRKSVV